MFLMHPDSNRAERQALETIECACILLFMKQVEHLESGAEPAGASLELHHIALGAARVEPMAEFYRLAFGLAEVARHHTETGSLRSIWLRLGSGVLMIEQTDVLRPKVQELASGAFLLAFSIRPEQRQQVEARLLQLGAPPEKHTEYTSYFRDPEGNRVAVSCYPLAPGNAPA